MTANVLIVDAFCLVLAVCGSMMAFRQKFVRRLIGRAAPPSQPAPEEPDPITYMLRISGIMIMAFGVALGLMVTLFNPA